MNNEYFLNYLSSRFSFSSVFTLLLYFFYLLVSSLISYFYCSKIELNFLADLHASMHFLVFLNFVRRHGEIAKFFFYLFLFWIPMSLFLLYVRTKHTSILYQSCRLTDARRRYRVPMYEPHLTDTRNPVRIGQVAAAAKRRSSHSRQGGRVSSRRARKRRGRRSTGSPRPRCLRKRTRNAARTSTVQSTIGGGGGAARTVATAPGTTRRTDSPGATRATTISRSGGAAKSRGARGSSTGRTRCRGA